MASTHQVTSTRILHLEDSPHDGELIREILYQYESKLDIHLVSSGHTFASALRTAEWDLVIADYNIPGYDGMQALDLVRSHRPQVPFIFISGSVGEQFAIDAIKRGATDYVLKSNLIRLPHVIKKALEEAAERAEARRAQAALHEVELRSKAILETVVDSVLTINQRGQIETLNPAAELAFGFRLDDQRGQPIGRLLPLVFETEQFLRDDGLPHQSIRAMLGATREVECRRMNGTYFPAELTLSEVHLEGRRIFTAVIRDITRRKALEMQLQQAQKMEALGQLAGGVSHDFNNLLAVILGRCELLMRRTELTHEKIMEDLEDIQRAGDRAANLTRQLLAFSRKQVLDFKPVDLNRSIENMDRLVRRLLGVTITIELELDRGIGSIRADEGQIEQVILNLTINARDAMPQGGRILLKTEALNFPPFPDGYPSTAPSGHYVRFSVSDNGMGMSAETKARIFEPFFTTKELGKGTGLGLATVHGVVSQCNGFLSVESELGKGTTFNVYFPLLEVAPGRTGQLSEGSPSGKGTGTILVVDDDDSVRELMVEMLTGFGYKVLAASEAQVALELLKQHAVDVRLAVVDLALPAMSGWRLSGALRELKSDLKIMIVSGYPDGIMKPDELKDMNVKYLQKPFSSNSLWKSVCDSLVTP